jgi:hypothetical protein
MVLWEFLLMPIDLKVCPWSYKQVSTVAVGDEVWGECYDLKWVAIFFPKCKHLAFNQGKPQREC